MPTYSPDQHNAITAVQMALESLAQAMLRVRRVYQREDANLPEHTKHVGVALADWIAAMPVYDCPAHLERVAVWLHPETIEGICEKCAAKFTECENCHLPVLSSEAVQLETGDYHGLCAPEEVR